MDVSNIRDRLKNQWIALLTSISLLYLFNLGSIHLYNQILTKYQSFQTVPSAQRPFNVNIVLLFPDDWRFDWADDYFIHNLSIHTPIFDSIVASGTRFVHTIVASPLCAPSRSCIASGKEYDFCGVPSNNLDFPSNQDTIYNLMSDSGYWVMMSGKDDLTKEHGCGVYGTYNQHQLGFNDQRRCKGKRDAVKSYPRATDPFGEYLQQHYVMHNGTIESAWHITHQCQKYYCCLEHNRVCPVAIPVPDSAYQDNYITQQTLAMLDDVPHNKPWFLQINWAGPHEPFIITKSMNETVNDRDLPYPMDVSQHEQTSDMLVTRRDYVAEIENLDKAFGKVIDKIRDMGQYENTLICVSSDHGEMLGDFNIWGKSKPWAASTNVPFACMGPGVKRNHVIDKYVTNMDLAGTFLDYTNTEVNTDMSTVSLRSFLNGSWTNAQNEYRDYVLSGLGDWRMVVTDINASVTWKFVCCKKACPERYFDVESKDGLVQLLFNIAHDLYEETNVAHMYPLVVKEMRSLIPLHFC
eukprot:173081_1